MATKTLGTLTTGSLTGQQWPGRYGANSISDADIAAIANAILMDDPWPMIEPGAFSRLGLLYVPRRGILKMLDGDWAATDASGFPYLVPRISLPTTLTAVCTGGTQGTPGTVTFAASVLPLGWRGGTQVTGTNVSGEITAISGDGLTITINTTGVPSGTMTAGTFTHA